MVQKAGLLDVAVIGVSLRVSGADAPEDYWRRLLAGGGKMGDKVTESPLADVVLESFQDAGIPVGDVRKNKSSLLLSITAPSSEVTKVAGVLGLSTRQGQDQVITQSSTLTALTSATEAISKGKLTLAIVASVSESGVKSSLVLKSRVAAEKDGDRIYGVIMGLASTFDEAVKSAGVTAANVDYMEVTNGTTPSVLQPVSTAVSLAKREYPIVLSTEGNKCPLISLVKAALSLEKEIIPTPENGFDSSLSQIKGTKPELPHLFLRGSKPRISSVIWNEGTVLLQEGVKESVSKASKVPMAFLPLSGKNNVELESTAKKYGKALVNNAVMDELDACYTASVGRDHLKKQRGFMLSQNRSDLVSNLLKGRVSHQSPTPAEKPTLCFLFPGQGAHYHGMGKDLYNKCPEFKLHFDTVAAKIEEKYKLKIKPVMWEEERKAELDDVLYAQSCIFAIEYALFKVWEFWGVQPSVVLCHSFGEYAASVAAGVIDLDTALEMMVGVRLKHTTVVPPGGMLVCKGSEEKVQALVDSYNAANKEKWIDMSAMNSDDQTVVSGPVKAIEEFAVLAGSKGIKTFRMNVAQAYHSRAYSEFAVKCQQNPPNFIKFKEMKDGIKYASSVTGKVLDKAPDGEYFAHQPRLPVKFIHASKAAYQDGGARLFLEVGPFALLSPLVMRNVDGPVTCVPCMHRPKDSSMDDWSNLLTAAGQLYTNGIDIKWDNFYKSWGKPMHKVSLPFSPVPEVQVDA